MAEKLKALSEYSGHMLALICFEHEFNRSPILTYCTLNVGGAKCALFVDCGVALPIII